jgi:cytochrome d ubiquinol oxidase subunit I
MKLASIEAMWETEPAPAPFTAIGFPDQEARETHFAVKIPWVMGLIGTRSLDTQIPGINDLVEQAKTRIRDGIKAYDALMQIRATGKGAQLPEEVRGTFAEVGHELGYALLLKRYVDDPRQASEEQIAKAAADTIPHVPTLFWSFRIMVGLGMFFILLTATFFYLSARRRLDHYPLLLKVAVFAVPLPWIAAEMGWVVAEFGRQPWIIEGVLPTAAAVSSLSASTVLITLLCFIAIYTVLFIVEMGLMLKAIRKGPDPDHEPEAPLVPEKLVAAE